MSTKPSGLSSRPSRIPKRTASSRLVPICSSIRPGGVLTEQKETDKAITPLEKALETDTKKFPSSAFTHAKLVSKKRQNVSDYEGAVDAFREGLKRAADNNAEIYWNGMAEVWESQANGNKMVNVYQEVVDKDRDLVYRYRARSWFHTGLVEEKLRRKEDANTSMEGDMTRPRRRRRRRLPRC